MRRRTWLWRALSLGLTTLALPAARAAPSSARPLTARERRLQNRLELWATFAARTRNLRARYTLTRTTSLLRDPLVVSGTLAFVAPDTLVMRDDARAGATTRILGRRVSIEPNDPDLSATSHDGDPRRARALSWYRARLVGLFAPDAGDADELARDEGHDDGHEDHGAQEDHGEHPFALPSFARGCELEIPRGHGMQLLLQAPAGDPVARVIRSFRVRLDPTTGAVFVIDCVETRGDRVVIELSDHRQNVDPVLLEELLRPRETPY